MVLLVLADTTISGDTAILSDAEFLAAARTWVVAAAPLAPRGGCRGDSGREEALAQQQPLSSMHRVPHDHFRSSAVAWCRIPRVGGCGRDSTVFLNKDGPAPLLFALS